MSDIEQIIAVEWKMFQLVQNEGGRASCQDNYPTFRIMRQSQLSSWPADLAASYLEDLEKAWEEGDNLLQNKYGYMMAQTAPEDFEKIREDLPPVSPDKAALVEQIVALQMVQIHALAEEYPKFVGRGRLLDSSQDETYDTSFETYLRGELKTYSEKTLQTYLDFMHSESGSHLIRDIQLATARLYGYASLEEVESRL